MLAPCCGVHEPDSSSAAARLLEHFCLLKCNLQLFHVRPFQRERSMRGASQARCKGEPDHGGSRTTPISANMVMPRWWIGSRPAEGETAATSAGRRCNIRALLKFPPVVLCGAWRGAIINVPIRKAALWRRYYYAVSRNIIRIKLKRAAETNPTLSVFLVYCDAFCGRYLGGLARSADWCLRRRRKSSLPLNILRDGSGVLTNTVSLLGGQIAPWTGQLTPVAFEALVY